MNSASLRPIEDLVGKPVLQIAKARSLRCSLKLRIIDDEFRAGIAGSRGEDRGRLKQTIGHRVCKICPLDALQSRTDGGGVQQIAFNDFGAAFAKTIGLRIQLVNEGSNLIIPVYQQIRNMAPR